MQGRADVIELLNEVLTAELTAINQYFIHAKMQQDWGYPRLAEHTRAESIDEMKHAEMVVERILFLEGVPNLQRLGAVRVGETVPEQFRLDLEMEYTAIERFNRGIVLARDSADNGTREMLAGMLVSEEEHTGYLETQIALIDSIGESLYLSQQLHA
ncbi:MAG: bacterioferritin [Actinomycetota bacterium]|nr:bacterioferritin [Actinomycetota bacterium]MDP9020426.1 bacterioferritin [Actinomycetota bacterium]